jgi:hypothetical protein
LSTMTMPMTTCHVDVFIHCSLISQTNERWYERRIVSRAPFRDARNP